ncbi:FAD-binding oxidoreductase [Brevibacterium sp. R8603A2]|uniref:NAD(P)/FAD-dependent oxidoreductase n=1 Tax=Brevibacterium sp. R8603A2 TaxID=2929779 RepID=UPI001FFB7F42|nr:FAD-dependent oxidoreductase [Brevibacterium sp. R8603A2]MCK1803803.1 FAD-binding oxidoreductase [Brevibacterium sp. R8603A2]
MHVIVVGAGIVGLASAFHLARAGAEVTVLERERVAAGASWGNAGWVCPGLVAPLAEPGGWRHGIQAITDPDAPLSVPRPTPQILGFLTRFAAQMTTKRFSAAIEANAPLTREALAAFDRLAESGVTAPVHRADYHVGAESASTITAFEHEVELLAASGVEVAARRTDPAGLPYFSDRVAHALTVTGQAYIDPGAYCRDLARAARAVGVEIREGVEVVAGHAGSSAVSLIDFAGAAHTADTVLVAAGAWSDEVLGPVFGTRSRTRQTSGRGYSFTAAVAPGRMPDGPVYLPTQRIVLTPYRAGVRIAGTMEFLPPDAPPRPGRIDSIAATLEPFVTGIDLADTSDHWVGPRPVSDDGRPVLRRVARRGYVATGHGMWGIVLGPVTGERMAEHILAGG